MRVRPLGFEPTKSPKGRGSVCAGPCIFLTAQIFNLQEHWPSGILMWAIGALAGWLLLRHWTQAALLALLVPAWLAGEWEVRTEGFAVSNRLLTEGLLLMAITYLCARTGAEDSAARRALAWIGGIALLPIGVLAFTKGRGVDKCDRGGLGSSDRNVPRHA